MDIPTENTGGDCFVEAVNNAMADNSLYVVHGVVNGQGALEGLVFPHAWNETEDGYVIDTSNGHDICMPSVAYYAIGRIDRENVRKYDYMQMTQEVVRTGTYGPWDDMFDFDYRVVGAMKKSHKASSYANKRTAMPWDKLTIGGIARELRDSLSRELYGQPWSSELCNFTIEGDNDSFGPKLEVTCNSSGMYGVSLDGLIESLNRLIKRYDPDASFEHIPYGIGSTGFMSPYIEEYAAYIDERRVAMSRNAQFDDTFDEVPYGYFPFYDESAPKGCVFCAPDPRSDGVYVRLRPDGSLAFEDGWAEGKGMAAQRAALRRRSMRAVALSALREVRADSLADVRDKLVDSRFWSLSDLKKAILRAGLVVDDVRSSGSDIVAFDWSGNGYVIQVDSFDDGEFGSVYEVVRVLSD